MPCACASLTDEWNKKLLFESIFFHPLHSIKKIGKESEMEEKEGREKKEEEDETENRVDWKSRSACEMERRRRKRIGIRMRNALFFFAHHLM